MNDFFQRPRMSELSCNQQLRGKLSSSVQRCRPFPAGSSRYCSSLLRWQRGERTSGRLWSLGLLLLEVPFLLQCGRNYEGKETHCETAGSWEVPSENQEWTLNRNEACNPTVLLLSYGWPQASFLLQLEVELDFYFIILKRVIHYTFRLVSLLLTAFQPLCLKLGGNWKHFVTSCLHVCGFSHSVMSDSATPRTVAHQCSLSMDFPGKNTGVGCHFLLQGIFPAQGLKLYLWCLLHCWCILYPLSHWGSPYLHKSLKCSQFYLGGVRLLFSFLQRA